jgi:hypothetical protein
VIQTWRPYNSIATHIAFEEQVLRAIEASRSQRLQKHAWLLEQTGFEPPSPLSCLTVLRSKAAFEAIRCARNSRA